MSYFNKLLKYLSKNDYLKTLQILSYIPYTSNYFDDIFYYSCEFRKPEYIKTFINNNNYEQGFVFLCRYNHWDLAKWIYDNYDISFETRNEAFGDACESGNMDIARWLFKLGVDIHYWNDSAFRYTCYFGHIKIAKWLYTLGADIHASEECAMLFACRNNRLEIAQWLYELGVEINYNDYQCFFEACHQHSVDIIKWFYDIGEVNNDRLKYIFEIACHLNDIKLAMWVKSIDRFYINYLKYSSYAIKSYNNLNQTEFLKFLYHIADNTQFGDEIKQLIEKDKEIYFVEFVSKLEIMPIYANPMFDMNVFIILIPKFLFY